MVEVWQAMNLEHCRAMLAEKHREAQCEGGDETHSVPEGGGADVGCYPLLDVVAGIRGGSECFERERPSTGAGQRTVF